MIYYIPILRGRSIAMKIFIVGCGKIGSSIIDAIDDTDHDIVVLERDEAKVQRIIETRDVLALCVDGTDFRELKGASIDKADWVIATTNSDESNLLTCFLAKNYGAKHTICQVRRHEYSKSEMDKIKSDFGIDMLYSPDLLAAEAMFDMIDCHEHLRSHRFKRNPRIMLMGASKIGIHLARLLSELSCSVKLIELNKERAYDVSADLNGAVDVIYGDGTEKNLLFEEGIHEADAFVALTGIDEENLLMSVFAQSHNVPRVIAKVDRNVFSRLGSVLGVTELVSPMIVSAEAVRAFIFDQEH